MARLGREVRPGVERLAVGGQEHGSRPSALTGHRHARVHRQRVDVGAFLAIDLDVHEQLVHQRRCCLFGERLVLHHVAPVARAVADRDEQRPILRAGAPEGLLPPRIPVDRIVGVLEEVGARGLRESVHALFIPHSGCSPAGRCRMVARMRRTPLWLVLAGGVIVVIGVLIQAFTIAAYVRGAGDGALDAHGGFSMVVHIGQLLIVIGAIWAFWGNWTAVGARGRVPRPLRRAARLPRRHGGGRAAGSTACTACSRS